MESDDLEMGRLFLFIEGSLKDLVDRNELAILLHIKVITGQFQINLSLHLKCWIKQQSKLSERLERYQIYKQSIKILSLEYFNT